MCKCFNVSRSSYYEWSNSKPSKSTLEDQALSRKIQLIFNEGRRSYGTRRIKKALERQGLIVSRRCIGRLMNEAQISCKNKRKFQLTTDSNHQMPISPNLLNREFIVKQPDTHYVGDITYIRTEEGWLYLAVVLDLFSRRVVGWSIDDNMRAIKTY